MTSALFIMDCGLTSGLGHVRRSLVLADAFRREGVSCKFHITSDIAIVMLRRFGFTDIVDLDNIPPNLDLMVVDGNSFTKKQINSWKMSTQFLCVIDDNGNRPVHADVIINPNLYAKSISYSKYDTKKLLLGPDYHLVSPEFFTPSVENDIDYLISFGGTDDGRLAGPLIKKLLSRTDKNIVWAVPSHICPQAEFVALAGVTEKFSIETDGDIPDLLSRTHCYIGGAGTMVSEALVSKCKVVSCAIVANQDKNIEFLKELDIPAFCQFDVDLMVDAALKINDKPNPELKLKPDASESIAQEIRSLMKG